MKIEMSPKAVPVPARILPEKGYQFNISDAAGKLSYILIITQVDFSKKTGHFRFFLTENGAVQFREQEGLK